LNHQKETRGRDMTDRHADFPGFRLEPFVQEDGW